MRVFHEELCVRLRCIAGGVLIAAAGPAHYEGILDVTIMDDGRHAQLTKPYRYVDMRGTRWDVPAGAIIDGASIPQLFWSFTGGPFEGKYRNASVIHDWYCDRRTRPWRDVDRMFYEAMLTSGVSDLQAKYMYLAVV